ncbi:MAG: fibronectin type III domain-containing protein, partial [Kiritimatiellae bacterium]|nr:fibronectin type III domain-containing protein [Kiritimatiellia bacterium]
NSSDETGFKIDRRKSGTTTWERIATPAANATSYTDSGLASTTQYYYQVKATNGAGDSPYSNTASATTGETAPAAPSSLAAAAQSATSIRLTWTDNSSNETGFKIDRRKSGATTWERIATPAANATSYTDSGLTGSTQYYYQVKATSSAGDSPYSNVAAATTQAGVPAAPSSVAASATSATAIRLTWTDNSGNETGFKIDRRQSGTDAWDRIATPAANATSYTDSGLTAAAKYYYKMKAYNSAGDSAESNVADATTPDDVPPPAIAVSATSVAVSCAQGQDAADATFQVWNSGGGTLQYKVVESTSKFSIAPATGSSTGSGNKQTHTIAFATADLTAGTYDRDFTVEDNGSGAANGPISVAVQITVSAGVPAAPSGLTATAQASSRIDLSWEDNSLDETGFKIDRRESGTDIWERVATPAANATSCSDSGLAADTTYYYKVKAASAAGDSAYSAVAGATTPAGGPEVRIGKGARWQFRKGTAEASEPAGAWRRPGFDDSEWAAGAAPFGYSSSAAEGPFGTTLSDMRNSYSCLFMRKALAVESPGLVQALHLGVTHDDGFLVWINGQEVARVNMAGTPGSAVSSDAVAVESIEPVEWTATLTGGDLPVLYATNVVAVQAFNCSLDSSDMTIDLDLAVAEGSALPAANDADSDGMDDAWEIAHFGGTGQPTDGDADGDGMSNLEEYIAGTAPGQNGSCFVVDVKLDGGQVVVSFPTVAASGTGYDGLSRHYALERQLSQNGSLDWAAVAGYADLLGNGQMVTYTEAGGPGGVCFRGRVWLEQ